VHGAVRIAARNLRVDHTTAVVLRALALAGVEAILLKGPSTVRWLYRDDPRGYQDCDLLVAPQAVDAAERVLSDLGYRPTIERGKMPIWWREHSVEWVHPELALVDLHHSLKGVGVDEHRLWEVLRDETETMVVAGHPATVLSLPARALQLALNRAGDGYDNGDVARAVDRADRGVWERATTLAREIDATAALATGLRLVAPGDVLADSLELPRPRSVGTAIRVGHVRREALTVDRLANAGVLRRATIVGRKLVPPPTFMRHWSPRARRGRMGLLIAYLERLVWVARGAPTAIRVWRRAQEAAQEDASDEA
jgi:hypothetical protein